MVTIKTFWKGFFAIWSISFYLLSFADLLIFTEPFGRLSILHTARFKLCLLIQTLDPILEYFSLSVADSGCYTFSFT